MINSSQPGVCGWCIDRFDIVKGIEVSAAELGVLSLQIGFFSDEVLASASATIIETALSTHGISLAGTFLAFEGEDYSSIESIARTGGFMDDETFEIRSQRLTAAASLTADLKAGSLSIHAGTIPAAQDSVIYKKLVDRIGNAADIAKTSGIKILLETGREPIDTLCGFIDNVGRPNVGVSFDPANLVIYGVDDPVKAVAKLKGRIDTVHLKDARHSDQPGATFGSSAPLGMGDAQIPRVLSKLRNAGYDGPMLVEVRGYEGQRTELIEALNFMRSMS